MERRRKGGRGRREGEREGGVRVEGGREGGRERGSKLHVYTKLDNN